MNSNDGMRMIFAGGGGHALSLLEAMNDEKEVAGYLAPAPAETMPLEWLGDDSLATTLARQGYLFHMAFVYAGLPLMHKRRQLIDFYENAGASFYSIIAHSAVVTRHSSVADGCAVLSCALVNRASLAQNVIVNSGAIVEHDCIIGKNSFIGPGAVLGGTVSIGENCFIGLGTKVKNGVSIADNITVGMGAVVDRDLVQPGIYHGNPLKFHKLHPRLLN